MYGAVIAILRSVGVLNRPQAAGSVTCGLAAAAPGLTPATGTRSHKPKVDKRRIGIFRNAHAARQPQRAITEVREQRFLRIARSGIDDMALRAIALLPYGKKTQAALLLFGELRFPAHHVIELRGKRLEHARAFKGGDRGRHRVERCLGIVKNRIAPHFAKLGGVRGLCDLGDQRRRVGVIHFHRVEKRLLRLFFQRVGTTVPKEAACRHAFAVAFDAAMPKARRGGQIHQGGRVARAELVGAAAQRHPDHGVVVAGEGAPRVVARGARRTRRLRQVGVEKQAQAEPLARRQGSLINGGGQRQDKLFR